MKDPVLPISRLPPSWHVISVLCVCSRKYKPKTQNPTNSIKKTCEDSTLTAESRFTSTEKRMRPRQSTDAPLKQKTSIPLMLEEDEDGEDGEDGEDD